MEGAIRSGRWRLCLVSAEGVAYTVLSGSIPIGISGTVFLDSLPIGVASTLILGSLPICVAGTVFSVPCQ